MSWIESFPATDNHSDRDPAYLFFVDVEGHADDEPVRRALESVRKRCEHLDVIGPTRAANALRAECFASRPIQFPNPPSWGGYRRASEICLRLDQL
jgi:hypothetical protein